jgi:hypothetical protein
MIPGHSWFRNLLLVFLGLGAAGCTYSWSPRPSPESLGGIGPTKLDLPGPPVEDPPRPSEPLTIPGPAPVKHSAPTAQRLELPPLTPPVKEAKEAALLAPVPHADAVEETKPLAAPTNAGNPLRSLYTRAAQRYASIEAYTAHLKRRERVNGKARPEEEILFKFRKQPWSVYFKWVGSEHRGREVIFVKGQHEGKIHTLTAAGDGLFGAGKHWALLPDNILVMANSRHSITESGVGVLIDRFGDLLDRIERGDPTAGAVSYLGGVRRPEFDAPVEGVQQNIPPGAEKGMDRGGQRLWFFDPELNLPLLTITTDSGGQELEYSCYHHFLVSVRLSDADFNPNTLWRR